MQPFGSVDLEALRWLRTAEEPEVFELRSGAVLIARLTRARRDGSLARAETAEGQWTLKRVGFLHPRVTVRSSGSTEDLARLDIHWRRTTLHLASGDEFGFERAGLSVPAWQYLSANRHRAVHIEPVRDGRKLVGGAVTVNLKEVRLPVLPLMLLTGWYYIVQEWFEDEAVAAGEAILDASAGP